MYRLIENLKLHSYKKVNTNKFFKDDIFIVSYPKSGNTWMRFLLANLMTEEEINFHSAVKYIPDFEVHDNVVNSLNRPRILKSHSLFNKNFSNVIYIIRDPRDVYVSYFHYLKKKLNLNDNQFNRFLRMQDLYPSRWHHHVTSWLNNPNKKILLIKYEDMLVDTFMELKKVVQFIGWQCSDSEISMAIEKSSFASMSKLEEKEGRPFLNEKARKESSKFVRSGKSGDWKNYFDVEDLKYLNEEINEVSEKFGYYII